MSATTSVTSPSEPNGVHVLSVRPYHVGLIHDYVHILTRHTDDWGVRCRSKEGLNYTKTEIHFSGLTVEVWGGIGLPVKPNIKQQTNLPLLLPACSALFYCFPTLTPTCPLWASTSCGMSLACSVPSLHTVVYKVMWSWCEIECVRVFGESLWTGCFYLN